jgi:hypothetical protein
MVNEYKKIVTWRLLFSIFNSYYNIIVVALYKDESDINWQFKNMRQRSENANLGKSDEFRILDINIQ